MKTLSHFALAIAVVAAAFLASNSAALASPRLVYSDEFNCPLNTAVWSNSTPWNAHDATGELEYYDPADCTLATGCLDLKSEHRSAHGYSYTSGIVTSVARAKFSYGYFEIRAKLPQGPGIWPAFWLTNDATLEIDGLEMLGDHPTRIYQTLHEAGAQVYQGITDGPDYSAGFHTYGIDWQPTYVNWYIDGVLTASYPNAMPPDPMWICLNTAIGGAWSGPPTPATTFPVDYDIDYIRVYDTRPAAEATLVAGAGFYSTAYGRALSVPAPGVLTNAADSAGDTMTASVVAQPAHGVVHMRADGSFEYTPNTGFSGSDAFSYVASHGTMSSDPATVSITVADPIAPGTGVLRSPILLTKPVVTCKNRARRTYAVTGRVHVGPASPATPASSSPTATGSDGTKLVVWLRIQRRVYGRWHRFSTPRIVCTASRYAGVVALRPGVFRVCAHAMRGGVPAATSAWTKAFWVR